MTILPDMNELADRLFGTRRAETTKVSSNSETITLYGVATTDSEDGMVSVDMTDAVYLVDDENELIENDATTSIQMPTHVDVREGDEVAITLVGNSTAKAPVVSGVVGGGDRQQAEIDAAADAASAASTAASAAQQEIADFKGNVYTKAQTDKKVQDLDDEISTELTTNYYNKSQIDTNYATKTLVSQTREEIELSASQTYATKGIGNPNLSPFYAHDLTDVYDATDNPDGYWKLAGTNPNGSALPGCSTQLIGDGWAHVTKAASSTNMVYAIMPDDGIEAGMPYTVLFEFANAQLGDNFRFQVANATIYGQLGPSEAYIVPINGVDHLRLTYTAVEAGELIRFNFQAASAGELDIRVSAYEGEYDGPFKPYVTDQEALGKTYATNSALTVGLDGIRQEVASEYQTIDGMGAYSTTAEMNAAIQTSATGIEQSVAATYSTKQATADAIAAIQVGGRNLITLAETVNGYVDGTTGAITSAGNVAMERTSGFVPVTPGETYVMQSWCEVTPSQQAWSAVGWYDANETFISRTSVYGTAGEGYAIVKADAPANAAYARVSWSSFGSGRAKFEQGTLPTDYTAATEDLEARPNLTPFGTHDLADVYDATDNPDGYWVVRPNAAYVTQLGDGWLHFERTNTGSAVAGSNMATMPMPDVGEGELLTVLMEVRNNQSTAPTSGNPNTIYVQQANNAQLWGNAVQSSNLTNDSAARIWLMGESFEKRLTKVTDSEHKTGDYTRGFYINVQCAIGQTLSFDFRVSVYRGGYEGGYVPYSIEDTTLSKTYTKSSTFVQTVNGLDGRITATEDGITLLDTLIRLFQGGVLAGYVGNAVSALMNAAGSFDVVQTTWQDGEPTIADTLASFGASLVEIGKNSASAVIDFCAGGVRIAYDSVRAGFNILSSLAVILESRGTSNQNVSLYATEDNDPATSYPARDAWINAHASSAPGSASITLDAGEYDSAGSHSSGGTIHILDYGTILSQSGFIVLTADDGVRVDNSANNKLGTLIGGIFFGTKIINPNGAAYGTLFTQAECVSSFGRALSQSKDVVLAMNGDFGVYGGQMTASVNSSSEVRVYMNPTRSGNTRINYLVILGA